MDRNKAKELLPIIQAFVSGEEIQVRSAGVTFKWEDTNQIFIGDKYRIKPQPIEIWCMVKSDNHCMGNFNSEINCHNQIDYINSESVGSFDGYKPVMFRQVID